jgi:hypothetical protein
MMLTPEIVINNADGIFEPLGIVTSIPMYLE